MLTKATKENVFVGLTNIYDHLFVSTETRYSKVTNCSSAVLWWRLLVCCCYGSSRDHANTLKKVVKSRSLKAMGYVNPPKGKAKDILPMENVCQPSLLTSSNWQGSLNWLLEYWIPCRINVFGTQWLSIGRSKKKFNLKFKNPSINQFSECVILKNAYWTWLDRPIFHRMATNVPNATMRVAQLQ